MTTSRTPPTPPSPVAVGGVGGSGTRLVADVLRRLGFHLGGHLNAAGDALWFTLLFKYAGVSGMDDDGFNLHADMLVAALTGGTPLDARALERLGELAATARPRHSLDQLRGSADTLAEAAARPAHGRPWGWKEPNTHVVIERLWARLPRLRYVHVVRNGLDMAFSRNQNQLELWGPQAIGEGPASPARSLRYWCHVHQRMQALLAANPTRMYWLDYDALCRDPGVGIPRLCRFLGCPVPADLAPLLALVQPQAVRHASMPLDGFAPADIDYVRSLGFAVHQPA